MIPYEYVWLSPDGRVTERLLKDWPLQDRERRALTVMLFRLFRTDWRQAVGSVIFKEKEAAIYYAKATGDVQLRPRLCRGPSKPNDEVTFLVRAIEKGNTTIPADAAKVAAWRFQELRANDALRRRYRPMPPQATTE